MREGSVRKSGNRVRITGQLIDAETGGHVWADRFDGELKDVFDLQDRITEAVVGAIEPAIRKSDLERARRKRPENLDAYDLYLQALPRAYALSAADTAKAFRLAEQAISIDPEFAPALALSAWCLEQGIVRGWWPPLTEDDRKESARRARAALAIDSGDAIVNAMAGFALQMTSRDFDTGIAAARRAIALNPNAVLVLMLAGLTFAFGDQAEEAHDCFERAMSLSPADPAAFIIFFGVWLAAFSRQRYDAAADLARESAGLNSEQQSIYWLLSAANAHLGRIDATKAIPA